MTNLLMPFIVLVLIAWGSYTYIPAPVGVIIAMICGVIFLIRFLLPLL